MARKLLIKKYSEGVFGHKDSEIALEFFVSKFFIDIDQNYFQIKEGNGGSGARRFPYLFTDVSIQVGNGVIETYNSKQALLARLIEIRYTGMMDYVPPGGAVTSITVNDENYTPDGNGLVNLGTIGGGGSSTAWYYEEIYPGGTITVPAGLKIMSCYIEQGSHIYPSQRSIVDTTLTITGSDLEVDMKLTIEGFY